MEEFMITLLLGIMPIFSLLALGIVFILILFGVLAPQYILIPLFFFLFSFMIDIALVTNLLFHELKDYSDLRKESSKKTIFKYNILLFPIWLIILFFESPY